MAEEVARKTRLWLLTGEPGAGKSTALSRIIFRIKTEGYTVGGVLTREVRSHGEREGFTLMDVSTEESAMLATAKKIPGPRIGKYHVNLSSLSDLGVGALRHAKERSDVVVCDEVGPMELLSPEFRSAVEECILNTSKPTICIVHKRLIDPIIDKLKEAKDATILEIDFENRYSLPDEISDDVIFKLRTNTGPVSGK